MAICLEPISSRWILWNILIFATLHSESINSTVFMLSGVTEIVTRWIVWTFQFQYRFSACDNYFSNQITHIDIRDIIICSIIIIVTTNVLCNPEKVLSFKVQRKTQNSIDHPTPCGKNCFKFSRLCFGWLTLTVDCAVNRPSSITKLSSMHNVNLRHYKWVLKRHQRCWSYISFN